MPTPNQAPAHQWTEAEAAMIRFLDPKIQKECPPTVILRWIATLQQHNLPPTSNLLCIVSRTSKVKERQADGRMVEKYVDVYTIQPTVDLYRYLVHKSGEFDGMDDFVYERDESGSLIAVTCRLYRKGCVKPIIARRTWKACVQTTKEYKWNPNTDRREPTGEETPNSFWAKDPEGMMEKSCESLCYRRGFADCLFGLPDGDDEGEASMTEQAMASLARSIITNIQAPQQPTYAPALTGPMAALPAPSATTTTPPVRVDLPPSLYDRITQIWQDRTNGAPHSDFLDTLEAALKELNLKKAKDAAMAPYVRGLEPLGHGPALIEAFGRRANQPKPTEAKGKKWTPAPAATGAASTAWDRTVALCAKGDLGDRAHKLARVALTSLGNERATALTAAEVEALVNGFDETAAATYGKALKASITAELAAIADVDRAAQKEAEADTDAGDIPA